MFSASHREIALKFSKESCDIEDMDCRQLWLLLGNKVRFLEIAEEADAPTTSTDKGKSRVWYNLHSFPYTSARSFESWEERWFIEVTSGCPNLQRLDMRQKGFFGVEFLEAMAKWKDTLTEVTPWVGKYVHSQLYQLLENCPSLRKLTFGSHGDDGMPGDALVEMAGKCPHWRKRLSTT